MRLTSDGFLKPCLHSELMIDLKKALRGDADLDALIIEAVAAKPQAHHLCEGDYVSRNMNTVGG